MNVDLQLPEVAALVLAVEHLRKELEELRSLVSPPKAWYTRQEVAALKGINKGALDHHTYLYPGFGQARRVGRRDRFHVDIVREWLRKTDEDIEREYREWKKSQRSA